jgi:hypothetical protein
MLQTDVTLVLLDPDLDGTAGLPKADLTTLACYQTTWCNNPEDSHLHMQSTLTNSKI